MSVPFGYLEKLEEVEEFLDDALETAERRFERAIGRLQERVLELVARLEQLPDGTMKGGRFALSQALALEERLQEAFQEIYGRAAADHVKDFDLVAAKVREQFEVMELDEAFASGPTRGMVQALAAQTETILVGLGELARNQVSQAVYDSVLAGRPYRALAEDISRALVGLEDKLGKPLGRYARMMAHDSLMEVYARVHRMNAANAGLEHFLYFGTSVRDTRAFCLARVGKVFTAEQVEAWESQHWRGKKPGSIWVTRGGYNCRHQFVAVKPEWVEEDQGVAAE